MNKTRNERRRDRKWKWLLGVSAMAALGFIGGIETGGSSWLLIFVVIALVGIWTSCKALGLYTYEEREWHP